MNDGDRIADERSGLFSEAFLRALLPTRVATARRALRHLGLVALRVNRAAASQHGDGAADVATMGGLIQRTLRDSDIAARLEDGTFVLLLEFTPPEGCTVVAERLARRIADEHPEWTCAGGVACYPAHAVDSPALIAAARDALGGATGGTSGTVAVAPVTD